MAFSPDGPTLASGGGDYTIRLWNTQTGELIRTLEGHGGGVASVAFSPDGAVLASGSWDSTIRLWNTRTGETMGVLAHSGWVYSVAFSPDGTNLASGSWDGTIRLWNAQTGELVRTLTGGGPVRSVAFSPDGGTLVSGGYLEFPEEVPETTTEVRLWDTRTGRPLNTLKSQPGSVHSVALSPNGATLASGISDHTVRLWDTRTGKPIHVLEGHADRVLSVAFSPDGATLASGSGDETIRFWDLGSRESALNKVGDQQESLPGTPLQHPLVVEVRQQNGDLVAGTQIAFTVTDGGGTLSVEHSVTDSRGRAESVLTLGPNLGTNTVKVTSAGLQEVTFTAVGSSTRHVLRGHTGEVNSVAFSPDGTTLASGSDDGTIRLWNAGTGERMRTWPGHTEPVLSVAFSPDGTTLASGSKTLRFDCGTPRPAKSSKLW